MSTPVNFTSPLTSSSNSNVVGSDRIVFMGTPEFAQVCLKALSEVGMNIVGVVTIADKTMGRGLKVQFSAVKQYALDLDVPILQPLSLKDPDFINELEALNADLFIVVAFRMLPKAVWNMPRLGTFNLHASLLPLYRGAAPIQRALWNGETETGVTTFLLDEEIDTGAIIERETVAISPTDNAASLHDKLLYVGKNLVISTAKKLLLGQVSALEQNKVELNLDLNSEKLPIAPKILKEDCYLNWDQTAEKVLLQIRALSPYPGAIALFKNTKTGNIIPFKVFDATISHNLSTRYKQGCWHSDYHHFLEISCGNGISISLTKLQIPGKKTLTIEEFLKGFRCEPSEDFVFCNYEPFASVSKPAM